MYGLDIRFHLQDVTDVEKIDALLNEVTESVTDYWHDIRDTEVQQKLYFIKYEKYFNRSSHRMIDVHLHRVIDISDHRIPGRWQYKLECVY